MLIKRAFSSVFEAKQNVLKIIRCKLVVKSD